jgi:hypothetical protein
VHDLVRVASIYVHYCFNIHRPASIPGARFSGRDLVCQGYTMIHKKKFPFSEKKLFLQAENEMWGIMNYEL